MNEPKVVVPQDALRNEIGIFARRLVMLEENTREARLAEEQWRNGVSEQLQQHLLSLYGGLKEMNTALADLVGRVLILEKPPVNGEVVPKKERRKQPEPAMAE